MTQKSKLLTYLETRDGITTSGEGVGQGETASAVPIPIERNAYAMCRLQQAIEEAEAVDSPLHKVPTPVTDAADDKTMRYSSRHERLKALCKSYERALASRPSAEAVCQWPVCESGGIQCREDCNAQTGERRIHSQISAEAVREAVRLLRDFLHRDWHRGTLILQTEDMYRIEEALASLPSGDAAPGGGGKE